jgi:hypothetical protein
MHSHRRRRSPLLLGARKVFDETLRSDSTLKFIGIAVLRCEKELHGQAYGRHFDPMYRLRRSNLAV